MSTLPRVLQGLRAAKACDEGVSIGDQYFTPEEVQVMLLDLYEAMAEACAAEYLATYGGNE